MKLKSMIHQKVETSVLEKELLDHVELIFSENLIFQYYDLLKKYDFNDDCVKVMIGWLALLSGDNISLMRLMQIIDMDQLNRQYQSLFYDLKALTSLSGSAEDRIKYNDLALDLIKKDKNTFFYANVHLTRGQIHAGLKKYRKAGEYFYIAYQTFFKVDMMFPASVAVTNAMLNWFKLGEFEKLLNLSQNILLMSSQFKSNPSKYWDVVKLPIGMTYAAQLKMKLAEEFLKQSKKTIDDLNLVHMHGYVELYLMDVYHYNHDGQKLEKIFNDTDKIFNQMNYPFMRVALIYGKILRGKTITSSDIQFIEIYYDQAKLTVDPLAFELLQYLSIHESTVNLSLEEIVNHIKDLRYHGDLINLATSLLLLAEYYARNQQEKEMYLILEELVDLYEQHHIKHIFYRYPISIWKQLQSLNSNITKNISKLDELTYKEQEIMSYIKEGYTNKDIAEKLFISIGTVKWHINNIYRKLDVTSRVDAINQIKK